MPAYIYNMGLRFKAVASANATRPALCFPQKTLGYAELDALSDAVASHLLAAGVKQSQAVAIHAEKTPLTYATMLAALKIGAPYVVLDTASPKERLGKILSLCQPSVIVSEGEFKWENVPTLNMAALEAPIQPIRPEVIAAVNGTMPAYLMFTSGSTGFPKGVTVSHANMLNFADWAAATFEVTPDDRFSGANALYFDNSVFDFTASLFNGASLVPVERDAVTQPRELVTRTKDCTIWFSVPSLLIYLTTLRALTSDSWPKMRAIIFGGEGYAKAELKKLHSLYGEKAVLWNVYGPTECTCICSSYPITERDFEAMDKLAPLGHMAPNFTGWVVDETGARQMPDGELGELFLTGPQVALGYYNDPERTRASFAPSPFSGTVAQSCYRTGDLVWRDATTGYFHFAGRKDNQIKHMGYRIELEEIEAVLNGFAEVAQSAVIYHKKEGVQTGAIIAFVDSSAEAEMLLTRLRDFLPSYMIPQEILIRGSLPKNANGKVDRKALAAEYGESHA